MNAIVTVDNNWAIENKHKPFVSIPAETKTRMQEIAGKAVVYDLRYLPNLPGSQPITGCQNFIYKDKVEGSVKGALCFDTLSELRKALSKVTDEIYVIHGEAIYREFMKDFSVIHVTKIDYEYTADAFFENLDKNPDFIITARSDEMYCFDVVYEFIKYERR